MRRSSQATQAPALEALSLIQLSSSVYLYSPTTLEAPNKHSTVNQETKASGNFSAPELIILLTWMSARPLHISKYVSGYQNIYPTSQILVVRSSPADMLWRSTSTQRRNIQPAVSTIERLRTSTNSNDPEILFHIFSNGGSNQSRTLLQTHAERITLGLPPHAKILDSCPGRGTFAESIHSLSASLPKAQPLRLILLGLLYLFICAYWIVVVPFGMTDPIERIRQALNDRKFNKNETSRCYIYSDTDDMVSWRDIEAHAEDARQKGFAVQTEKFKGSGHCAHIRVDGGTRYWGIVNDFWKGRQD